MHVTTLMAACLSTACFTLLADEAANTCAPPSLEERVRIATFNIWVGGQKADADKETSRRWTQDALRSLRADIIGVQEQKGFAPEYAAGLGYTHFIQADSTALLLAPGFDVIEATPQRTGARVRIPGGRSVWVFNVHLPAAPYQPYQLHGIEYHDGVLITTSAEAVTQARLARGEPALGHLRELMPALESGLPVFLLGDFNEPSHLDWTPAAVEARGLACAVDWPTTRVFHDAGMRDAYRAVHPDPVAKPGFTWTPRPDERDMMDRIDMIMYGGRGVLAYEALVAGEAAGAADLVISPWPSDHRAVLAVFNLGVE
jgi:exodeoxyribonuclease-3